MEIEQKFRVDDATVFADLMKLGQLGGYELRLALAPELQNNIYFDTADGRLRASHYGLRVRVLPDRRIATLKGRGAGEAGRYERPEWETQVGDDDDPASWPPGELRERVLGLIGDQQLAPLLRIETHRQHLFAAQKGREVAEISLDQGTIYAGGRSQAFRELEIELRGGGTLEDLDVLCTTLLARFSLAPDDRSKLQRGLALLEG